MSRQARVLFAVVALVSFFAMAVGAAADYAYKGTFSGPGSEPGQLESPGRAAVEQSTGNLFVVDSGNDLVQVFKPNEAGTADFLTSFGVGELSEPWGIAIAEGGGQTSVYVADAGNGRIVKYDSDEAESPSFTVDASFETPSPGSGPGEVGSFKAALAIDPTSGDLLVADTANKLVQRFEADGDFVSAFDGSDGATAFEGPIDLAVNSSGDVYVIDANGPNIREQEGTSKALRYSGAGSFEAELTPVGPNQRPATIAVDLSQDTVAVSAEQDAVFRTASPTLHLFNSANNPLPAPSMSAKWNSVSGLATFSGVPGGLYVVLDYGYLFGGPFLESTPHIQAFVQLPLVSTDPVEAGDVTATSAEFSGSVDPLGKETSWHFEYSRNSGETWFPTAGGNAGSGIGPVAVAAAADGLRGNSTYLVRLVATSSDGTATSEARSFQTPAAAPIVETLEVGSTTDTSAWLKAEVNPTGLPTTYHFEYGTSSGYGSRVPAATEASAGSGTTVTVSQLVTGLQPGATYHYRIVATNELGTSFGEDAQFTTAAVSATCPNEAIREAQGSERLPRCRAYEQVSPSDKSAGAVAFPGGGAPNRSAGQSALQAASPNGEVASFTSYQGFANPTHGMISSYRAVRTGSGWTTAQWSPVPAVEHLDLATRVQIRMGTPDLSVGFTLTEGAADPLDADSNALPVLSGKDVYRVEPDQTTTWISRGNGEVPATEQVHAHLAAVSDDGEAVFFQTTEALTPEAEGRVPGVRWLYRRDEQGTELVSAQTPDGTLVNDCGAVAGRGLTHFGSTRLPVSDESTASADGERIAFSAPDPNFYMTEEPDCQEPQQIYVLDGSEVLMASASQRAVPDEVSLADFQAISRDGAVVYFTTDSSLTEDAPMDGDNLLYRFDVETRSLTYVDDLVYGVARVSEDGRYAYYVRENGDVDLKLDEAGENQVVAAPQVGPAGTFFADELRKAGGWLQINPSGEAALVRSRANLTAFDSHGLSEVYLYRVGEPGLTCISCNREGRKPLGDSSFISDLFEDPRVPPRFVSDDGETAFFQTEDALAVGDSNGAMDVYEWHEGRVSLISSGKAAIGSYFFDASVDGSSVFFATPDSLLRSDIDSGDEDIYVARVNGGFAEPDGEPGCSGEACQGVPAAVPPKAAIGSGALSSQPSGKPRRKKACVKPRKGKRSTARAKCGKKKGKGKSKASGRRNGRAGR